jgi:NTP pyrophosphatase (non-canonical NTP hydrolase)
MSDKKDMTGNEYQWHAHKTSIYYQQTAKLVDPATNPIGFQVMLFQTLALALASELGEVATVMSEWVRDENAVAPRDLSKEFGDLVWVLNELMTQAGLDFEDVMKDNLLKVETRKRKGFIQRTNRPIDS